MILLRQRLLCLSGPAGGIAVGLVLALITQVNSGAKPAILILVAALPFFLAVLTGMAKTTTA